MFAQHNIFLIMEYNLQVNYLLGSLQIIYITFLHETTKPVNLYLITYFLIHSYKLKRLHLYTHFCYSLKPIPNYSSGHFGEIITFPVFSSWPWYFGLPCVKGR